MRNVAILLLLVFSLGGCDLFRVRDSDPPAKPAPWNSYATNWDLCLENLEYCYGDSRNAVKYQSLFTPDFAFHFSAQDVNDYSIPPTWTASQEQDMLLNLHSQSDSLAVILSEIPEQPDEISSSEANIYRRYEVLRYFGGSGEPETYSGELELNFGKSEAYWHIESWYDYRSEGNPTWGKLKHDFSQ